jgi:peptide/nickel transport system permease protein
MRNNKSPSAAFSKGETASFCKENEAKRRLFPRGLGGFYLLRRIGAAWLALFGAATLIFLVLYWLPGDPATLIAGGDASPQTVADIRAKLGTDAPLWQQYTAYLWRLLHGDLGTSFATNETVWHRLAAQIPATAELTLAAALVALVAGTLAGATAAMVRGKPADYAIQAALLLLTAMPTFWVGLLLILTFSVHLRWLPAIGNGSFRQLILPALCLGIFVACRLARMVRETMVEILGESFVTALHGKGLLAWQVYAHVLRNTLIPVVTLLGVLIGELISGAVVTETLFARQGLGRLLVEAVGVRDIPVVMGVTLLAASVYIGLNLLVDLSYRWIDPRVSA